MKERLPGYVQKCFLASGFDTEEAIAFMDVESITTMETFVDKRFSHDPSMHSKFLLTSSGSSFEFPPGHRALILRFIKQVRENYNTKHSQIFNRQAKSDNPSQDSSQSRILNKRPQSSRDIEIDHRFKKIKTSSNIKNPLENTNQCDSKVYRHVKSQIDEWIDKHAKMSEILKNLSEEHYSIRPAKETGVVVYCQLCKKEIKLQPSSKKDNCRISNWTKHIKSCFLLNYSTGQTKLPFKSIARPIHSREESSTASSGSNSLQQTLQFNQATDKEVAVSTDVTPKWSREERAKRQLLKAANDPSQSRITDYLQILNDIEKLLQTNIKLSDLIQQYSKDLEKGQSSPAINLSMSLTPILKQLILNAEKNSESLPHQRRHPEILKKFATALLIYAGPLSYEFIQSNMPEALPSLRTVQRFISKEYSSFTEGFFNFDGLLLHIKDHKTAKAISVGEDATRVVTRIDYDCETDRCVGFVLPLDSNGLPLVDSFLAVSYKGIEEMFHCTPKAKYAYVYMVQPLSLNAPPFCLACIGSDNKFTAQHVLLRWKYIYEECTRRDMLLLSFGGDGDSRIMSAMKQSVSLLSLKEPLLNDIPSSPSVPRIPSTWKEWFQMHPRSTISYVQDVVHVGVKLKARLLKPGIHLPMGPHFCASGNHLQMIRMAYGKDEHNLRERDVNHKDKQNFDAVLHIMNLCGLLKTIPEAKATFVYVEMMKCTVDSYLDKSLSPLERIEKAWYANFFARYWKEWISLSDQYTLKQNFLTSNAYLCIELNAHSLVTFLMNARDNAEKDDVVFLPWLLGSQSCERIFRSARSMSTVFSSVLNFSILGLLRRLHRLNIQTVLQADAEKSGITFPRIEKNLAKHGVKSYVDPTIASIKNRDIFGAVESALKKAKDTLSTLEMDILLKKHSKWDNIKCSIENCDMDTDEDDDGDDQQVDTVESAEVVSEIVKEVCEDDPVQVEKDLQSICTSGIADSVISDKLVKLSKCLAPVRLNSELPCYCFTDNSKPNKKTFSPFIEVSVKDKTFSIRKTTAIWLLQENERVSSDRLFRVREKQPYSSSSLTTTPVSFTAPSVSEKAHIGDLCVFKVGLEWQLGRILQLSRYNAETRKYDKPFYDQSVEVTKHVGVMCSWYQLSPGTKSTFELSKNSTIDYHSLESYVCTLPESCIMNSVTNPDGTITFSHITKPTKQSSLTAKQISITDDCLKCLLSIVETSIQSSVQQISPTKRSTSTSSTSAIVIPDDSENDDQVVLEKDLWTKCGGISLGRKELQRLLNDKELSDLHINAFQNLVKKQFPAIGGLQSTLLQQKRLPLDNKQEKNLQIIHITITQKIKHWAVLEINSDGMIYLYDSAYTSVVGNGKHVISQLLNTSGDSFSVNIMDVGKQAGATNCGVYAIATLTCLAHGKDPCSIVFKKEDLRSHLQEILLTSQIKEFPSTQRRKRKSRILSTEVFEVHCICRMPDDGCKMVCCDRCNKWFHASCVHGLLRWHN